MTETDVIGCFLPSVKISTWVRKVEDLTTVGSIQNFYYLSWVQFTLFRTLSTLWCWHNMSHLRLCFFWLGFKPKTCSSFICINRYQMCHFCLFYRSFKKNLSIITTVTDICILIFFYWLCLHTASSSHVNDLLSLHTG